MANYIGKARSNYIRVKDVMAFNEWADQFDLKVGSDDDGRVCVLSDEQWPDMNSNGEYVDFVKALSTHLVEDEVAILMEVGSEKLRYVYGQAQAVDHKGHTLEINLNDIYKLVEQEWESSPTHAEY